MKRAAGTILGLLAVALAAAGQQPSLATVTTIQVPPDHRVRDAAVADLDADGLPDVLVASSRGGNPPRRFLRVHLHRREGPRFAQQPDHELAVDGSAVAFATGDVHADPGREVLLFTSTGAFAWRRGQEGRGRFVRLTSADFLWQYPHPRTLFHWPTAVRDLDGDGLDDLFVPEPGGWRLAWQARGEDGGATFTDEVRLRSGDGRASAFAEFTDVAATSHGLRLRRRGGTVKVGLKSTAGDVFIPSLLDVVERCPAPVFADWDADGRPDLLGQTERRLLVWRQREGRFRADPDLVLELPVEADRSRQLDISYSSHVADLNSDGRADCVIFSGDQRSKDVRTQIQLFLNGVGRGQAQKTGEAPLFGPRGYPQQVLVVAGFAGVPQLEDIDGDGFADLVAGAVRPDLLESITSRVDEQIEAELYVYLNDEGRFSRQADLVHRVRVSAEGLDRLRRELTARFFADVTGDGVRELLLRDEPGRVRVLLSRRRDGRLSIHDDPLFELNVQPDASLRVVSGWPGKSAALLVLEDRQVLGVTFP